MRELYVVALSEDGGSVLLATTGDATRGGFRVAVNDRLAAAVRGDLPRPGEQLVRDSTLTPKEIQSRLRAGASPAQIAREAGVAVARVERFSGPVLSERARVVDAARSAYLVRGRLGRSLLSLGEAVTAALEGSSGYREDSEEWTTKREEDGRWTVAVTWFARARIRTASWTWDPGGKELLVVDPAAAALGHVAEQSAPTRRTTRSAGPAAAARPIAVRRPAPTPSRAAGPSTAAQSRTPSKVVRVAKPAAKLIKAAKPVAKPKPKAVPTTTRVPAEPARRSAARAAPARQLTTKSKPHATPTRKPVVKPSARPVAKPSAKPSAKPVAKPAVTSPPPRSPAAARLRVVRNADPQPSRPQPQPQPQSGPQPQPQSEPRAARGRASVPDWADVLLGTAPRRDESGTER